VVIDLSYNTSPQAAMYLLNSLRKFWYSYPTSRKDVESWHATIRKLIIRVSRDVEITRQFREQNPHLVVSEQPTNRMMESRRSLALDWHKMHQPQLIPVQESFSLLGYKHY